jgi:hypothetical protein
MFNPFRRPFIIMRPAPGEYIAGEYEEGPPEEIAISASVQPLRMSEQQSLPDGQRTGEAVKIYSDERLYPALQEGDGQTARRADRLIYDRREWEIVACSQYQSGVINHYKSYAIRSIGS